MNAKDVRSKISSIKNTKKITIAMEMVAASKMRKSQEKIEICRPYEHTIQKIINHLLSKKIGSVHPCLNQRIIKCVCYIVISSDRGLCGGLNNNLFKKTLEKIEEWKKKEVSSSLVLIGAKANIFFSSTHFRIISKIKEIGEAPYLPDITKLVRIVLQEYNACHFDKICIISNQFINKITQKIKIFPLLPIQNFSEKENQTWDYLYEPNPEILLEDILRHYIKSTIYKSIIENTASEYASRIIAMKNATDNSSNLIKDLHLVYNKARQTKITQEIIEIISGAAAI